MNMIKLYDLLEGLYMKPRHYVWLSANKKEKGSQILIEEE